MPATMADNTDYEQMLLEGVVYYVDPKSVGTLAFLGGKERIRIPITSTHSSLEALRRHIIEYAGLKAESEKRGLGSCIELKLCRLAKSAEGSKAYAINTQAQWDEERRERIDEGVGRKLRQGRQTTHCASGNDDV